MTAPTPGPSGPFNQCAPGPSQGADVPAPTDVVGDTSGNNQRNVMDASIHGSGIDDFSFLEPPLEPDELGSLAHYRVLKLLGQGGMGMVFLAEDPRLKRRVALKVMRPELAQDSTARHRFLREARATASVRSDHIITIFEIGQANDLPHIATELLHGMPLDVWLKQGNRATPADVLEMGRRSRAVLTQPTRAV